VRFLGRVGDAELEALYAGAGVLVAPSRYEGFGIPIVEAGRLGCPSVYATGSAMTEVAGEGGLGFDPDDMNRCVELVRRVLGDANLRAELAAGSRRNAAPYTWRRSAALIFEPAGPEAFDGGPGKGGADLGSHRTEQALRVLHVTESFAAGTGLAIVDFARGAQRQGVVSFLLGQDRGGGLLDEVEASSPFRAAKIVKPGMLRLWREIGPAVRETRPDVVHAHSSLAGVVVRLRLMGSRTAVVYSPHCFAFERRDISRLRRHLYRLAEVVLARWTAGFVCVSPYEADLARGLRRGANVKYVINYIEPAHRGAPDSPPGTQGVLRLVSVGRIVRQKDPAMFAEVVYAVEAAGAVVEAVWIGDGDDETARRALLEAGVRVTGWVRSSRVRELLATHHYYVHTASWEALPIAVLDAMNAGLAVLVRRNKAYAGLLPEEWLFDDVAGALRMLERLRDPSCRRQRLLEQSRTLAALRQRGPHVVLAADYKDIHDSWLSRRSSRRLESRRKEP
jgi:glycosyltransferase involved in cell wall biosynthesis